MPKDFESFIDKMLNEENKKINEVKSPLDSCVDLIRDYSRVFELGIKSDSIFDIVGQDGYILHGANEDVFRALSSVCSSASLQFNMLSEIIESENEIESNILQKFFTSVLPVGNIVIAKLIEKKDLPDFDLSLLDSSRYESIFMKDAFLGPIAHNEDSNLDKWVMAFSMEFLREISCAALGSISIEQFTKHSDKIISLVASYSRLFVIASGALSRVLPPS
jgi:hypothetical protein